MPPWNFFDVYQLGRPQGLWGPAPSIWDLVMAGKKNQKPQPQIPQRIGGFSSAIGGPIDPRLSEAQNRYAGRRSIGDASLALMAASGSMGFLPAVAVALNTGRQSGAQRRLDIAELQEQAALRMRRAELAKLLPTIPQEQWPQLAMKMAAEGDKDTANTILGLINATKETERNPMQIRVGEGATAEVQLVDPKTYEVIKTISPSADAIAAANKKVDEVRQKEINDRVNELRDDVRPALQEYNTVAQQVARARVAGDNAIGDQTRIATYSRLIDPLGSVREGDVQRVGGAGGLPALAQRYFNQLKDGRLPESVREALDDEIEQLGLEMQTQLQPTLEDFRAQGLAAGIPAERLDALLRDPFISAFRRERTTGKRKYSPDNPFAK